MRNYELEVSFDAELEFKKLELFQELSLEVGAELVIFELACLLLFKFIQLNQASAGRVNLLRLVGQYDNLHVLCEEFFQHTPEPASYLLSRIIPTSSPEIG